MIFNGCSFIVLLLSPPCSIFPYFSSMIIFCCFVTFFLFFLVFFISYFRFLFFCYFFSHSSFSSFLQWLLSFLVFLFLLLFFSFFSFFFFFFNEYFSHIVFLTFCFPFFSLSSFLQSQGFSFIFFLLLFFYFTSYLIIIFVYCFCYIIFIFVPSSFHYFLRLFFNHSIQKRYALSTLRNKCSLPRRGEGEQQGPGNTCLEEGLLPGTHQERPRGTLGRRTKKIGPCSASRRLLGETMLCIFLCVCTQ